MVKRWLLMCGAAGLFMISLFAATSRADDTFDKMINDKNYKAALDYADDKIPAPSRTADVWVKLGKANESLGLIEKALACYLVSWRLNPKDYESLLGAARIYNKLDQPENALEKAQKALEINFTAEASWEYAAACIKLKRPADAKKALEKVIQTDSSNAIANRELGNIYYNDKQYGNALPLLQKSYARQPDADLAFRLGKVCLELNKVDDAINYLKEASAKNPSLTEATLELARCYYKKEKYLAAASEYEKIASRPEMTAMDEYARAVSNEKNNNMDNAIKAYLQAIEKFGTATSPEALTARLKVGNANLEKKNYEAALAQYQFIANADPQGKFVENINFLLADAYDGSGNGPKAILCLEKALAQNPNNIEATARLADLYEKNGMGEKAKTTYEKMISLNPNDPKVYMTLGQYNLKAKKFAEALKYFEKCYLLDHGAKSAEGIAITASTLNQWDKARDAAESAIKLDGNLMDARIILTKAYLKDKNFTGAKDELEFLVSKKPSELEYWKQLAICYDQTNDKAKLAIADKKIAEMDKTNVDSRLRLARYALDQKDSKQAFDMYKELSVLSPQNPEVFRNLYELCMKSGDKGGASVYLRKYIQLNPSDAVAQRNLGDLLYELKDQDGALNAYRAALKLDPTIKGFLKRYAELVIAKGQQDEVIRVLTRAIAAGEADVGSYTTLGMIYQKSSQFGKALEMYQKAMQMDPQNLDVLSALAECQAKTGDRNGAIITYEQVIMMNPKAEIELKELGDLYLKDGRNDQAISVYKKYLEKVPTDQDVAKGVGMALYQKKQYQEATKYFDLVKEKGAEDIDYLMAAGESYYLAGNSKRAQEIYEGLRLRKPTVPGIKKVLKILAESYEKDNNLQKAVDMYADYSMLPGAKDPDVAYKAGFLQEKVNPMRARKIYEDNVAAFPNDYRNMLRLGILYAKDKTMLSRSAALLKKASTIADTIPAMWIEMAQVYNKLGNDRGELEAYKKLVTMDPQNLEANKRLGYLLMKGGAVTDAMVYLEMANTLSNKDPDIMILLAQGYIKTNRAKDAIDVLEKAKALKTDDADIRLQLVELYKKTDQPKKALEEMKQLIAIKHDNKILLPYASALYEDGKCKEAEDVIEDIKATDPENIEALMVLARALRCEKKLDQSVETYKEISYINPNYAPALYERADVHLQQNKPQWAKTFFERALRADPNYALGYLGLARLAKMQKNNALYLQNLDKAIQLDPNNAEIKEEAKNAKR
ncbi:MAG TPA: tetratricopeptide repeat protein [Chitinivibrionales bacterium]|nr:tetratricopeptide repeat protein [Chitinivibrionales bacterium]